MVEERSTVTPYFSELHAYYEEPPAKYLLDKRVPSGKVIRITQIAGRFINCATTEYIVIGYHNGRDYVELFNGTPNAISGWVHWKGNIWLREGQRAYTYAADLAAGERQELRVHGRYV